MTLLEVLVVPYWANDDSLAARHYTLLTRSRRIRLVDVTPISCGGRHSYARAVANDFARLISSRVRLF